MGLIKGIPLALASVATVARATLVIFGASYTVTSCTWASGTIATMPSGSVIQDHHPVWNPLVGNTVLACGDFTPPPSTVNYTINYTLNYRRIAILSTGTAAIFLALRWNPHVSTTVNIPA
jgi:hypothetical protein